MCQLACTHGNVTGLANYPVTNSELFVDIMTLTNGTAVLPTQFADTPATAIVDIEGYDYWEPTFDLGAGTNANVLFMPTGEYSV